MAEELNISAKLARREGKKVSPVLYWIMRNVVARQQAGPMNLKVIDNVGVNTIKGPYLLFSNHTSRCDWEYIGMAMGGRNPMNFVASNVEFHRAHMHGIFDLMNVIPKMNFVSDLGCIKAIMRIVKDGGSVMLFPEGKSSISGTNQPVMPGTGSLVRKLGVPVYTTTIRGGYMSNTQWNIANRPGQVEIYVNKLLTPEEAKALSAEEIERRVNEAIYNDDFEWNKTKRIRYKGNDTVAVKLEEHLYLCPKCGAECQTIGEGNTFRCKACGNGMTIDEYYDLHPFDDSCVIPKSLRVWYELQRRAVYREIKNNPDFLLEDHVIIGHQPDDHYVDKTVTSEPIGDGMLRLTREGLSFEGTVNGEPFTLFSSASNTMSMVFETDSSNFGGFFGGKYYEFKPDRKSCTKWQIAVEEVHRAAGGRWQNTLPEQQWIYEEDKPDDKEKYYL